MPKKIITSGYKKYLRWHDKESGLIAAGKSRREHPLTLAKWRRATRNKQPVPLFVS